MSIIHISPLIAINLNGPVQSFFSRQTRISDCKDKFRIVLILGPFFIIRVFVTYRFACSRRISFVTLLIASAFYITEGNGAESFIILKYVLNISNVSTILFGPAKLLTALTAICNAISELILFRNSSRIISYTCRKG
jgi:hypothetical protein